MQSTSIEQEPLLSGGNDSELSGTTPLQAYQKGALQGSSATVVQVRPLPHLDKSVRLHVYPITPLNGADCWPAVCCTYLELGLLGFPTVSRQLDATFWLPSYGASECLQHKSLRID